VINFEINKRYSFNTRAPNVLGTLIENVAYAGNVSYDIARTLTNIDITQRKVYPELPTGTPNDHTKYTYHIFNTAKQGQKVILADYWIDESTVFEYNTIDLSIAVNGVKDSDIAKIRDLLFLSGFRSFAVEIKK
jgi:hypothetical protein